MKIRVQYDIVDKVKGHIKRNNVLHFDSANHWHRILALANQAIKADNSTQEIKKVKLSVIKSVKS